MDNATDTNIQNEKDEESLGVSSEMTEHSSDSDTAPDATSSQALDPKNKKTAILGAIAAVVAILAFCCYSFIVVPSQKRAEADRLFTTGDYAAALTAYESLNSSDSEIAEKIQESRYQIALKAANELFIQGDYSQAAKAYETIESEFSDVDESVAKNLKSCHVKLFASWLGQLNSGYSNSVYFDGEDTPWKCTLKSVGTTGYSATVKVSYESQGIYQDITVVAGFSYGQPSASIKATYEAYAGLNLMLVDASASGSWNYGTDLTFAPLTENKNSRVVYDGMESTADELVPTFTMSDSNTQFRDCTTQTIRETIEKLCEESVSGCTLADLGFAE